jgi:peptidoglycan/LPS O-acetylase OafA/YrhL
MPDLVHALPWAVLFFFAMVAVGHVSWRLVEEPPLRWRRPYFADSEAKSAGRKTHFAPAA